MIDSVVNPREPIAWRSGAGKEGKRESEGKGDHPSCDRV
jgi:hypothetical protein